MRLASVYVIVAGFLLVAWYGSAAAGGPNLRPGLWETTVRIEIQGAPMSMPSTSYRHCITKEDLIPRTERPGEQCKILKKTISGNTVTWRVSCKSRDMNTTGTGRITYKGDTYRGSIEMQMSDGSTGSMKMSQKIQGKRIGNCK